MAGKGDPKTGGRRKGTPNKTTADIKAAFRKHGHTPVGGRAGVRAGAN